MKLRLYFCTLLTMIVAWCSISLVAFADNELVPYDPTSTAPSATSEVTQTPATTSKPATTTPVSSTPDYTGDLFQEPEIVHDENVSNITNTVTNVASIVITFAISVAPVLLAIQMVIDMLCILLKPVALICSRLPIQINSDEAIMVTGIQFTGTGENNATNIEKKDLNGESPVLFYLKSKLVTIILAFTVLVLLGTGLLFKGVFFLSNMVAGWVAGLF